MEGALDGGITGVPVGVRDGELVGIDEIVGTNDGGGDIVGSNVGDADGVSVGRADLEGERVGALVVGAKDCEVVLLVVRLVGTVTFESVVFC